MYKTSNYNSLVIVHAADFVLDKLEISNLMYIMAGIRSKAVSYLNDKKNIYYAMYSNLEESDNDRIVKELKKISNNGRLIFITPDGRELNGSMDKKERVSLNTSKQAEAIALNVQRINPYAILELIGFYRNGCVRTMQIELEKRGIKTKIDNSLSFNLF